jgi:hypothetical protein
MQKNAFLRVGLAVVAAMALNGLVAPAKAQTAVESSAETRFQLDFHVPDDALAALLPSGWASNAATQGAAKDANMRVNFVDRVTVNGPDGKPAGTGSKRLVWLTAPVKDPTGAAVQLVISGLTDDPADVPGPFGVYLLATTHTMQRTTTESASGPTIDLQDWDFAAASGEHVTLHIKYERGVANRAPAGDVKFYSVKNPTFYQISHQEQVLDILRNPTTNPPDRVKEFSVAVSGGSYAKLFPGSQKVQSWDNILWINRSVMLP